VVVSWPKILGLALALTFAAPLATSANAPDAHEFANLEGSREDAKVCVRYWGEARYRNFGYDHVVHIANSCSRPAQCLVSTDVDPKRIRVKVAAGLHKEVVTRKGAPSRKFTPNVTCELVR
jgi:hypothetical protein